MSIKRRTALLPPPTAKLKLTRSPAMDRHVVKHNKLRFARKLQTLLLSKPRHYLPLRVLSKCRSYLSLPPARSILAMVKRYPTLFELCRPTASDLLSVRLSPAALRLAAEEAALRSRLAGALAGKLQRLLLLSSHRRLVLAKLAHLGPDLGLPANFRSRLCNDHPGRFRTVDTSYGRALELVGADASLAVPLPPPPPPPPSPAAAPIIDRPPKFRTLKLRKGLNLKRKHREFLLKFRDLAGINPYVEAGQWPASHTMEGEKRACAVVREVLAMTVEKRTLVDHLTHFRKEFGLPNKLRGMLVRHPEMFYVSLKGMRDSVFLVEGYDEKGRLIEKDESLELKERLLELVREGKKMRRDRRNGVGLLDDDDGDGDAEEESDDEEEEDDGFGDLFDVGVDGKDWEEFGELEEEKGWIESGFGGEYWMAKASLVNGDGNVMESW